MINELENKLLKWFRSHDIYDLGTGDGSCACSEAYVKGLWIRVHCHRSGCLNGCEFGGVHVTAPRGFEEDWPEEVLQGIGKIIISQLNRWNTSFDLFTTQGDK